MQSKSLGLLALLLPIAASAAVSYDYRSGPITSVVDVSFAGPPGSPPLAPAPLLGTDMTGVITLTHRLPWNGTVTVIPFSMTFDVQSSACCYAFTTDASTSMAAVGSSGSVSSFTATTANGVITSFSFETGYPQRLVDESMQADTASNVATFGIGSPQGIVSASASAGSLTRQHLGHGVPEIDPAGAGSALTLLAGVLAVLRGRRRRQSPTPPAVS